MRELAQLNEMTVDELEIAHRDISKELYDLNNEIMRSRKIEKPHLVRQKKKERARVLTLIRQKAGVNKL